MCNRFSDFNVKSDIGKTPLIVLRCVDNRQLFEGTGERIKAMIDFIKDADCTKETPVRLGVPDAPIYGKDIKLKPRVDGRTDSEHFKKIYLPELLPLEEYDLIVVLISGGKDSVACYLKLLELGVPKEKIEFWQIQ